MTCVRGRTRSQYLTLVLQDGNRVTFYSFVANTKTNSLRVGLFTCPVTRMNEIGQTAQTVMNQVIWIE